MFGFDSLLNWRHGPDAYVAMAKKTLIKSISAWSGMGGHRVLGYCALLTIAACGSTPTLPDPLLAGWNGKPVCECLHEDQQLRVLRCTFPPGGGHDRHFHAAHYGYVIAGGRMQITDQNGVRVVDVPAGSSFHSEGVEWHEVVNIGDTTSVYLIVEPKGN